MCHTARHSACTITVPSRIGEAHAESLPPSLSLTIHLPSTVTECPPLDISFPGISQGLWRNMHRLLRNTGCCRHSADGHRDGNVAIHGHGTRSASVPGKPRSGPIPSSFAGMLPFAIYIRLFAYQVKCTPARHRKLCLPSRSWPCVDVICQCSGPGHAGLA